MSQRGQHNSAKWRKHRARSRERAAQRYFEVADAHRRPLAEDYNQLTEEHLNIANAIAHFIASNNEQALFDLAWIMGNPVRG